MSNNLDKYGRMGAIVGGGILGFFVFGGIALRFLGPSNVSLLVSLAIAVAGAIFGAYSQVKRGDTLWKELTGKWW